MTKLNWNQLGSSNESGPVNQKYDSDFRSETTEKKLLFEFNCEAAFYHKILKFVYLCLIGWFSV